MTVGSGGRGARVDLVDSRGVDGRGRLGFGVERSVVREGWFQGRLSRALEVGIVSGRAE